MIDDTYFAYLVIAVVIVVSMIVYIGTIPLRKVVYPDDTVILHQADRGPCAPSLSPFVLKFETYLRMMNIPYQNDLSSKFSSKGKIPWITYNGVDVADSQFCIEYLTEKTGKDLNEHLTSEDLAIARAFQKLTEENLLWVLALWRWRFEKDWTFLRQHMNMPYIYLLYISRKVKEYSWGHGIGRHSTEEVLHIGMCDMRALSTYLGKKKFLMGSEPSEVDCAVFGLLAQFKWQLPDSPPEKTLREFSNLCEYCDRMKEKFWPDWDDCITHGGTRVATK